MAVTAPDCVKSVSPLRRRPAPLFGFGLEYSPFIILYAIALEWCFRTAGQPFAAAIAHEAAKTALKNKLSSSGFAEVVIDDGEEEEEEGGGMGGGGAGIVEATAVNSTAIAESMHAQDRKLPNPLLPDFWAVLFLAVVFILNALVWFVQRWSLRVKARVQYTAEASLEEGHYALVMPHKHQGAAEIVKVDKGFFMFQRQKFEIDASGTKVTELAMPVGEKLKTYAAHTGYKSTSEMKNALTRYGTNSLQIEIPSFKETFIKQILGPVPTFQFFCASLWLLDEYWNYALFNIFAIGMYECSVVFGKLKNMQALRGMKKAVVKIQVYREDKWSEITAEELLPGDIFSLAKQTEGDVSVPCDALVLAGTCVVNEATLTGESTPQMKEATDVEGIQGEETLDIEKNHRIHTLYSGTSLMQSNVAQTKAFPITSPDSGCVCYCLRTGFSSSEGKLVRMIEYSQEQVLTDAKEVLALLTLLLVFALIASGYVLKKGLEEKKRSQYELVLRCVLILTSVVPPELPMQTAVAVNTALFALLKAAVFCTEPFRITYAGKVEFALFDKTGTLTTDKLDCVGAWTGGREHAGTQPVKGTENMSAGPLMPLSHATPAVTHVLAGCHSLVQVGGGVLGDPIEMASLHAIGWKFDPASNISSPSPPKEGQPPPENVSVQVLHRFHFSSRLQRMSVLAKVNIKGVAQTMVLAKGSPEKILTLLKSKPENYHEAYVGMAERGMRVLALATRVWREELPKGKAPAREEVETDLEFAGFVAFSCKVRRDTAEVIKQLRASSHFVAMATGDAALTALYVSREVAITENDRSKTLILQKVQEGDASKAEGGKGLEWVTTANYGASPVGEAGGSRIPFSAKEVPKLVLEQGFELCVTGPSLQAAAEEDESFWDSVKHIKVFARMSPDDKEAVLRKLKEQGYHTLMCGDGANDVGALKQAHVGLALLSGFGGANTAKEGEKASDQESKEEKQKRAMQQLADLQEKQKKINEEVKKDQEDIKKMQVERWQALNEEMTARGESWAMFKAMKQAISESQAEMAKRNAARSAAMGGSNAFTAQAAMLATDMDDGSVPMVKLGDASVAAPFTSKLPSIKSTLDIIRQGRCTLVSTIQMQQVLALNCLISAYSLSALYLDGVRMGENQMIATGLLLSVASLAFSYARPVDKLSPVRPITTIFHPAIWVSIVGQLLIHLGSMMYVIMMTKEIASEEELKVLSGDAPPPEELPPPSPDGESIVMPFKPSLLNTVVFLIETAQQVSVMAVNYKGRPFMLAATENAPMGYSLLAVTVGVFVCAFEVLPWLNDLLKLVPMPSDEFRTRMLTALASSIFGSLVWDRVCVAIFAPTLLWVGYVDTWNNAPPLKDTLHSLSKLVFLGFVGLLYWLSDQNMISLLAGWYFWRQLFGPKPPPPQPAPTPGAATAAAGVLPPADPAAAGAPKAKKKK